MAHDRREFMEECHGIPICKLAGRLDTDCHKVAS